MAYNPSVESKVKRAEFIHLLVSHLAKMASFRFRERPYLERIRQRVIEETSEGLSC